MTHGINESFWSERRVFITGINGFLASHLTEKLLSLGAEVAGQVRRHAVPHHPNLKAVADKIKIFPGNLLDLSSLAFAFRDFQPDVLFHVGAQSFVPSSVTAPMESYQYNIMGTANVLEAVRLTDTIEAMQFAGSSEEYGMVYEDEVPIKETNPLRPLSPYAASKVAGDMMCYTHHQVYDIPVVRTRAFNHTGPRRGSQFVMSEITKQIAENMVNGKADMVLGNLEPIRDFTDVRDILLGYMLAIEKGEKGDVYNLGYGKGYSIGDVARMAIKAANLDGKMNVLQDKARFRKADVMILVCDASKAKEKLGWEPAIPTERTLADMIDYQLQVIKGKV